MKYMLLMHHGNEGGGDCPPITEWPPGDVQAHIGFMIDLNRDLAAKGELVAAEGLAWPNEAKVVVCKGGAPKITDGPYPETKEFLAGFWIVDVPSEKRAIEIAARASAAPGPKGKPFGIAIELRQVMSAPHPE
jgi:hypothetical protein